MAKGLKSSGYLIESNELRRAVLASLTANSMRQFVILAGPTGVGKTQLVKRLAQIFDAGYGHVPVRPSWVEPADLLGFFNAMHKLFEPTPFLDHLIMAQRYTQANRFYALCLDEMNLSRVENYAADLLSKIEQVSSSESDITLDLYSQDIGWRLRQEEQYLYGAADSLSPEQHAHAKALTRQLHRYPAQLSVPRGLMLFGTVNVDETTQMFSPKFLDRSFVLRFPQTIPPEKIMPLGTGNLDSLVKWPASVSNAQALSRSDVVVDKTTEEVWKAYRAWQTGYLSPLGVNLGHRFYAGFHRYLAIGKNIGIENPVTLAEDYFLAKIPPRIRFDAGEKIAGSSGETKLNKLTQFVEEVKKKKKLPDLVQILTGMIESRNRRGLVEYWD